MRTGLRAAHIEDAANIAQLHNRWSLNNSMDDVSRGFLLTSSSPDRIASILSNVDTRAFISETEGVLQGYTIATKEIDHAQLLEWELQPPSSGHLHVQELAVDPSYQGMGIGTSLYEFLRKVQNIRTLSAFIAVHPLKNRASLDFHKKQGFRRAASFSSKEFYGLTNYKSELWLQSP